MLLARFPGLALSRAHRFGALSRLGAGLTTGVPVVDCTAIVNGVRGQPAHLLRRCGSIGFLLTGSRTRLEGGKLPARFVFLGLRDPPFAFILASLMLALLFIGFEHAAEEPGTVVIVLAVHDHARVVLIAFVVVLGDDLKCLSVRIRIVFPAHDRGREVLVVFVLRILRILRVRLLRLPFLPVLSGAVELFLRNREARGLAHLHPVGIPARGASDHSGRQSPRSRTSDSDAHQGGLHLIFAGAGRTAGTGPDGLRTWSGQAGGLIEAARRLIEQILVLRHRSAIDVAQQFRVPLVDIAENLGDRTRTGIRTCDDSTDEIIESVRDLGVERLRPGDPGVLFLRRWNAVECLFAGPVSGQSRVEELDEREGVST